MLVSGDNRGKFEANLLYVESESDFGATAVKIKAKKLVGSCITYRHLDILNKNFRLVTVFFAHGGVEFDR